MALSFFASLQFLSLHNPAEIGLCVYTYALQGVVAPWNHAFPYPISIFSRQYTPTLRDYVLRILPFIFKYLVV